MRHRFPRTHSVDRATRRRGWLAAGGAGTSVIDDCVVELTLIAARRRGEAGDR